MRLLEYQPLETEIDLRKGSKQPLETQDGGCGAVEDQSKSGSNANVNNATCDWAGRCTPIFGGCMGMAEYQRKTLYLGLLCDTRHYI